MQPTRRLRPFIVPLQRPIIRWIFQLLGAVMLLWLAVFFGLNDRRLGTLISKIVSGGVQGQFRLGYAHYDYWSSLASIILNTPARVRGGDYQLIDPDGKTAIKVESVEAQMYIGELIRALIRTAFSAPLKQGVFVDLHFLEGVVTGVEADIHPTESSLRLNPDRPVMNVVAAMTGKRPSADNAPGRVRIIIDGDGVRIKDARFAMGMPLWHVRIDDLSGTATMRFSSASSDNTPGLQSFHFEVAPLTGDRGELTINLKPEPLRFPLSDISLRRFGARESRKQDLSFRGSARAHGARVEIDGKLVDVYCDTGVSLQLSFDQAGALASYATKGLLVGQPRGRLRLFGPFSDKLPTTPQGAPAQCLSNPARPDPYEKTPEPLRRALYAEGTIDQAEAKLFDVQVTEGRGRFTLLHGILTLPDLGAAVLSGRASATPLRISFNTPPSYTAQVHLTGVDPGQAKILTPYLRRLLGGAMTGDVRVSGRLGETRGELVRLSDVDADLDRAQKGDLYPRAATITGDVSISDKTVTLRDVAVEGDGLELNVPRGTVGIQTGRVNLDRVELRGGPRASRSLQALGLPATLKEVAASVQVQGTLSRPELHDGAFTLKGVESTTAGASQGTGGTPQGAGASSGSAGPGGGGSAGGSSGGSGGAAGVHLDEVVTGFTLHDGLLALQGLSARGGDVAVSGKASLQIFDPRRGISDLLSDPPLMLSATLDRLPLSPLLLGDGGAPVLEGALSAQLDLGGTVRRPTGTVSAQVPLLSVLGAPLYNVNLEAELHPDEIRVNSLFLALGLTGPGAGGSVNGSARIGRDGDLPLDIAITPLKVELRDIPGIGRLPYVIQGLLSGALRVRGAGRPLLPTLEGSVALDNLLVVGRPVVVTEEPAPGRPAPPLKVPVVDEVPQVQPLLNLPGVAVRTLQLARAALAFHPLPLGGTQVRGRLFNAFDVDGAVYLDPLNPHGELHLRFGCPAPGTDAPDDPAAPRDCDVALEALLPDLQTLAEVETRTRVTGDLHLRFGRGLSGDPLAMGLSARLQLRRAQLLVNATDDDGVAHRYRMHNLGEVALLSDGRTVWVQQARFRTERQPEAGVAAQTFGDLRVDGFLGPSDSDLRVQGSLRMELLEQVLRATFQHTRGALLVDARLRGPLSRLTVTGDADLSDARLLPHDVDAPIDVRRAHLVMTPGRAELRQLDLSIEGVRAGLSGSIEVKSYLPLELGALKADLSGALSARLLQWVFRRNLSEARGTVGVDGVQVTGTLEAPLVAGMLQLKDVYVNLRRFHELYLQRGSVRLIPESPSGPASALLGCAPGAGVGCRLVEGTVDADGRLRVSGRVAFTGLGGFLKGPWYEPLRKVDLDLGLQNVRHSAPGVYYIEVTAPNLKLFGGREYLTLSGTVDVVSGRYVQQFDLKDQFLSPRVVEEEEPFWRGDPYLSALRLDLLVATKGTVQVKNGLADLRLVTTDFSLGGALSDLRMGGTIRVEGGLFTVPGLRGEFKVKGDSKLEFSPQLRLPSTPWVDVRGANQQYDASYTQQRNVELALQGPVGKLQVQCISSDGLNPSDCAFYLALGGTTDQIRQQISGDPYSASPRALAAGDNAAKLLSSQITQQVADPLREKLRLDVMRIQLGVSSFDVLLCKNVGFYTRICGQAERGLLYNGGRYQLFGEIRLSDYTVGQLSLDRLERGFTRGSALLEDTLNRFKLQLGLRRPLRF